MKQGSRRCRHRRPFAPRRRVVAIEEQPPVESSVRRWWAQTLHHVEFFAGNGVRGGSSTITRRPSTTVVASTVHEGWCAVRREDLLDLGLILLRRRPHNDRVRRPAVPDSNGERSRGNYRTVLDDARHAASVPSTSSSPAVRAGHGPRQPLQVHSHGPTWVCRNRLRRRRDPLGRCVRAEVEEMGVPADLDPAPQRRRLRVTPSSTAPLEEREGDSTSGRFGPAPDLPAARWFGAGAMGSPRSLTPASHREPSVGSDAGGLLPAARSSRVPLGGDAITLMIPHRGRAQLVRPEAPFRRRHPAPSTDSVRPVRFYRRAAPPSPPGFRRRDGDPRIAGLRLAAAGRSHSCPPSGGRGCSLTTARFAQVDDVAGFAELAGALAVSAPVKVDSRVGLLGHAETPRGSCDVG
jgi:hypothetical protein